MPRSAGSTGALRRPPRPPARHPTPWPPRTAPCRAAVCASSDPSPVTTSGASATACANPTRSSTTSMPGRNRAPSTASAANPIPPAAPAPGSGACRGRRARPTPRAALPGPSPARGRALLRPVDRRGAVWTEQRVVHVGGEHEVDAVARTRSPSASSIPLPPSVHALPPSPSTIVPCSPGPGGVQQLTGAVAGGVERRGTGPAGPGRTPRPPRPRRCAVTAKDAGTGRRRPGDPAAHPTNPAATAASTVPSPPSATGRRRTSSRAPPPAGRARRRQRPAGR